MNPWRHIATRQTHFWYAQARDLQRLRIAQRDYDYEGFRHAITAGRDRAHAFAACRWVTP